MEIKGINMVWLSEVDLTNLNSGEGESNFVDVKKFKKGSVLKLSNFFLFLF